MTPEIYTGLVTLLGNVKDTQGVAWFKTIGLWKNQVEHELAKENDQEPFLKPACFIEFTNIDAGQLSNQASVQQVDFDTILHLVFERYLENDVTIMQIKQDCYKAMQSTEVNPSTNSRFLRVREETDYDNGNVFVWRQIYHSTLKDFTAVKTPSQGIVQTLTINQEFVLAGIGYDVIEDTLIVY